MPELSEFLSSVVLYHDKVAGDFNMHVDDISDGFAIELSNIMESFNFTCVRPKCGLDLSSLVSRDIFISDHRLVFTFVFYVIRNPHKREICSRVFNDTSASTFLFICEV